ncbi:MAG: hypothetical protein GEU81_05680 [Nitriliruptorales bacterium]|nr:hypothetical protein [Nitriliruptorales bacterium]
MLGCFPWSRADPQNSASTARRTWKCPIKPGSHARGAREHVGRFGSDVQRSALKRLARLDAAGSLDDLRAFPGNRVEKLRGDRDGQHSIRVNDQWRICFLWPDAGPEDVEIVDYH